MSKLAGIETKLEAIEAKLDELNKTLLRNTITVEQHEQRSTKLEDRFVPIEKHVFLVNGLVKVGVALLGLYAALKRAGLF